MELDPTAVHRALTEKGVSALQHANTVQTSCLFLQHGKLLSRGAVEDRGMFQTIQGTDELDKKYAIWHDIFLDAVDIHERAKARNLYGPVMFRFRLNLLLSEAVPAIWITKRNPTRWRDDDRVEDRYFTSIREFQDGYTTGDFGSMFMLRHSGGSLQLAPYLIEVVLDAPELSIDDVDLYSHSVGALRLSAWQGGLKEVPIRKRSCSRFCECLAQYDALIRDANKSNDEGELDKLFSFGSSDR